MAERNSQLGAERNSQLMFEVRLLYFILLFAAELFLRRLCGCFCGLCGASAVVSAASAVPLQLFLRPLQCLCGCFCGLCSASAVPLRLFLRPLRRLCGFMLEFYFTSSSTSILRPIRSQFYVPFALNFTSNSISILRPIRPQFYVQFDLNFTSNSTSILRQIISTANNNKKHSIMTCQSVSHYHMPLGASAQKLQSMNLKTSKL